MTDLRSALVNNYLFSVIAVRNGFHNYLKHKNPNLQTSIDKFIQRQEECDHMVLDEVMRVGFIFHWFHYFDLFYYNDGGY